MDKRNKIKFAPGDYNYQRDAEAESPFQKRNLASFSLDCKLKANMLAVRQRVYHFYFSNKNEPYLVRNISQLSSEKRSVEPRFYQESDLLGNIRQIEAALERLINRIIQTLESDPQLLFAEADRISDICQEENYKIPEFEAFNAIQNWEEFIRLLKSILANDSPFRFELCVSAIIQYARLCKGE